MKQTNARCWSEAQKYLVGGVNSPVRSFRGVGGRPFFVRRGQGPYLWDVEGKRYIDYVGSWGALILGHRPPPVIAAARQALERGPVFGTPTPDETELAKEISRAIPSVEQVRFVSSGTEAVMSAVRLARAVTGRSKIVKFDGGYHGHSDALLSKAGSGLATLGLPASAGVPKMVTRDTLTVGYNDLSAVRKLFARDGRKIACVLVEPAGANIGVLPPEPGFLKGLRAITRRYGALLIFDEVITGFRLSYGGAQRLYGVKPDLTTLGKIIGGGFPAAAYGGPRKLMKQIAPLGPVYQAGTLSGHPVAMAAGLATLKALRKPGLYAQLEKNAQILKKSLEIISHEAGIPVTVNRAGSLLTLFFKNGSVHDAAGARRADAKKYARYFQAMLKQGVYLPPSAYEAWFVSAAHGKKEIEMTLNAHKKALQGIR